MAAGWSSSRPSTTCSRALRPRRCRTSILPSATTNSKVSLCKIAVSTRPVSSQGPGRAGAALLQIHRSRTMSDLLWQKPGVTVDAEIQAFLAGDDVILDREFFLHDITASRAHAEGLHRIGILTG